MQTDLLGKPLRQRRPKYEAALERHELRQVPDRAERVRWLSQVIPRSGGYLMPLESMRVFQEAKDCFVYGQYVATVVLASAFAEHWLGGLLQASGHEKVATQGLAAIVAHYRERGALPPILCEQLDTLRRIRNPFGVLPRFHGRFD